MGKYVYMYQLGLVLMRDPNKPRAGRFSFGHSVVTSCCLKQDDTSGKESHSNRSCYANS